MVSVTTKTIKTLIYEWTIQELKNCYDSLKIWKPHIFYYFPGAKKYMLNAFSWAKTPLVACVFYLVLVCTCFWLNVNRYTWFWHLPFMKALFWERRKRIPAKNPIGPVEGVWRTFLLRPSASLFCKNTDIYDHSTTTYPVPAPRITACAVPAQTSIAQMLILGSRSRTKRVPPRRRRSLDWGVCRSGPSAPHSSNNSSSHTAVAIATPQ